METFIWIFLIGAMMFALIVAGAISYWIVRGIRALMKSIVLIEKK